MGGKVGVKVTSEGIRVAGAKEGVGKQLPHGQRARLVLRRHIAPRAWDTITTGEAQK